MFTYLFKILKWLLICLPDTVLSSLYLLTWNCWHRLNYYCLSPLFREKKKKSKSRVSVPLRSASSPDSPIRFRARGRGRLNSSSALDLLTGSTPRQSQPSNLTARGLGARQLQRAGSLNVLVLPYMRISQSSSSLFCGPLLLFILLDVYAGSRSLQPIVSRKAGHVRAHPAVAPTAHPYLLLAAVSDAVLHTSQPR